MKNRLTFVNNEKGDILASREITKMQLFVWHLKYFSVSFMVLLSSLWPFDIFIDLLKIMMTRHQTYVAPGIYHGGLIRLNLVFPPHIHFNVINYWIKSNVLQCPSSKFHAWKYSFKEGGGRREEKRTQKAYRNLTFIYGTYH